MFTNLKIGTRILAFIALVSVGLGALSYFAFRIVDELKVDGPVYGQLRELDGLRSVSKQPVLLAAGPYRRALELSIQQDPVRRATVQAELRDDEESRARAVEYWQAHLPPGPVRDSLVGQLDPTARRVLAVIDDQLMPAVDAGDWAAARRVAAGPMKDAYVANEAASRAFTAAVDAQLAEEVARAEAATDAARLQMIGALVISEILAVAIGLALLLSIVRPLRQMRDAAAGLGRGELNQSLTYRGRDELGEVADSFRDSVGYLQETSDVLTSVAHGDLSREITPTGPLDSLRNAAAAMLRGLRRAKEDSDDQIWLRTQLGELAQALQGRRGTEAAYQAIATAMARTLRADQAVLYERDSSRERRSLRLAAGVAHSEDSTRASVFEFGQGLLGQAAVDGNVRVVPEPGDGFAAVSSALSSTAPSAILVVPIEHEGEVRAVAEFARLTEFTEVEVEFARQAASRLGVVLAGVEADAAQARLLEQTQAQAAELEAQSEELEVQTHELESRQDQLSEVNAQLQAKTDDLESRRREIATRNAELERVGAALQARSDELERASQYKSTFLANMSHELRTPLNSLLILSEILAQNKDGNLTDRQVELASTVHQAGSDLLTLINEVLDLAKIESGAVSLHVGPVRVRDVVDSIGALFAPIAESKGVTLSVDVAPGTPETIQTDQTRVVQVLRNLLANGLKFTEAGSVALSVAGEAAGAGPLADRMDPSDPLIVFSVRDTGIGIPQDKQAVIFEAFQQADQGTSRRFGGTGLGLAISRDLARALGGDITVDSKPDVGSTFRLYLPVITGANGTAVMSANGEAEHAQAENVPSPSAAPDTAGRLAAGAAQTPASQAPPMAHGRVLLIVEDDARFAEILAFRARDLGFEPVIARDGVEAIRFLQEQVPDAVTLDLQLPDMDGWVVLDRLRRDPDSKDIPVQIISATAEEDADQSLGAAGYLTKPVSQADLDDALASISALLDRAAPARVLLVDADQHESSEIVTLLAGAGMDVIVARDVGEALAALEAGPFKCVIVDLALPPDPTAALILEIRRRDAVLPVIALTSEELDSARRRALELKSVDVIARGQRSMERLLDEASLFLHRVIADLPNDEERLLRENLACDVTLNGRTALIVDDDPRNVFALAHVLENHGMRVLDADSGRTGVEMVKNEPGIDVVLMDIMMPDMDGYEAIRLIRSDQRFRNLPILAVTALAMEGDRQRCIDAGASDYLSKPVDVDRLVSLLRLWLSR